MTDGDESGSVASEKIDHLTITAPDGSLNVAVATGAVVGGNNSTALTITGTQAQINATVASLVYTDASGSVGDVDLTFTSTDKSGLVGVDVLTLHFTSPSVGTIAADNQTGTGADDIIVGGGNNDIINGGGGNDLLIGAAAGRSAGNPFHCG